jgi:hypothetical protein
VYNSSSQVTLVAAQLCFGCVIRLRFWEKLTRFDPSSFRRLCSVISPQLIVLSLGYVVFDRMGWRFYKKFGSDVKLKRN